MGQYRSRPGYRRAAMLLVALEAKEPNVAAQILAQLGQDKAKELIRAVSELGKVSRSDVDSVMKEFFELAVEHKFVYGGKDISAKLLKRSFGITTENAYFSQEIRFFDFLDRVSDEELLTFLKAENMQARGLILHHLSDDRMASLFAKMPTSETKQLSQVLLGFEVPNPNLVWAYHQKLKSYFFDEEGPAAPSDQQYLQKLARVLENLGDESRADILSEMKLSNRESAQKLEGMIFTFDDLEFIPDQDMELILYEIEQLKTLAMAISMSPNSFKHKVLDNISDRIRLILEEEMDTLTAQDESDVQAAQREVLMVARRLEREKKIKPLRNQMMRSGGDK